MGSPLSPALFNIYLERVLKTLRGKLCFEIYCKIFADDIFFLLDECNLLIFLRTLIVVSREAGLIVNPKKSAILHVKQKKVNNEA